MIQQEEKVHLRLARTFVVKEVAYHRPVRVTRQDAFCRDTEKQQTKRKTSNQEPSFS